MPGGASPNAPPGAVTRTGRGPVEHSGAVSAATRRRLELAAGDLASACLAAMDRQPWFGRLTADQRAAVLLVTQRGVANFVAWLDEPAETIRLTAEAFRIAPRDLARRLSLRQTVELVRIATDVFEERLPPLAADDDEHRVLVEGVLRFGRGVAFAAATDAPNLGMPAVICGPGRLEQAHTVDEYVELAEVRHAVEVYLHTVVDIAG